MTYPAGIDVSSYQPTNYDTRGLSFVFVKATESTSYTNPRYAAQLAHGRAAGLVVGHYHFLHPGNAAAQADYFLAHADVKPGDILACDWEASGCSEADRDAFMKRLKAQRADHRVILYCNRDFWLNVDTESYCGDGLWIADIVSAGAPRIKAAWRFHQYSSASGIDKNVANFADGAALRAWATGLATPPKPPTGTSVERVLAIAKAEVGYHEGKDAAGNWDNVQKYSEECPDLGWSDGQPWCATFVAWCAWKAGLSALYPRTASCAEGVAWFKAEGRWSDYPAVGAQVFYGANGGAHTGIVHSYDDTYVYVYEGNTNNNGSAEGDGVYDKTRVRRDAYVFGYGYPKFVEGIKSADPAYAPKPAPAPTNGGTMEPVDVWAYKHDTNSEDAYGWLGDVHRAVAEPSLASRVDGTPHTLGEHVTATNKMVHDLTVLVATLTAEIAAIRAKLGA